MTNPKINLNFPVAGETPSKQTWSFNSAEDFAEDVLAPKGIQPGLTPQQVNLTQQFRDQATHVVQVANSSAPEVVYGLSHVLTDAERGSEYYSVGLPSDFYFYPFKTLSVKQVTGRQQAKFSKAAAEENPRYLVEGVSSMLGDGVSAYSLTPQDFFWLLYWILFSSYPDRTVRTVVQCTNPEHVAKVKNGELEAHSLSQLHEYKRPIMSETNLDLEKVKNFRAPLLAEKGLKLKPFTMKDAIEWEENFSNADSEAYYLAELAVNLDGGTIEERMEIVAGLSIMEIEEIKSWRDISSNYGVDAKLKSTCKECGAVTEVSISVSAHDFL